MLISGESKSRGPGALPPPNILPVNMSIYKSIYWALYIILSVPPHFEKRFNVFLTIVYTIMLTY